MGELDTAEKSETSDTPELPEIPDEVQEPIEVAANDQMVKTDTIDSATESKKKPVADQRAQDSAQVTRTQYETLDSDTFAQYNRETDTILINDAYRDVTEQALVEPLMAHERVHASYKTADPIGEESLQRYVDEELEAYQAQHAAWQARKQEFEQRYPTGSDRGKLGEAARELLSHHLVLERQVHEQGWQGVRASLEQKYHERLTVRQSTADHTQAAI